MLIELTISCFRAGQIHIGWSLAVLAVWCGVIEVRDVSVQVVNMLMCSWGSRRSTALVLSTDTRIRRVLRAPRTSNVPVSNTAKVPEPVTTKVLKIVTAQVPAFFGIAEVAVIVVAKVYVLIITKVRVSMVPEGHGFMLAKVHATVLMITRQAQYVAKMSMHHFDRVAVLVAITYVHNIFASLLAMPHVVDVVSVVEVTWAVDVVLELLYACTVCVGAILVRVDDVAVRSVVGGVAVVFMSGAFNTGAVCGRPF